MSEYIQRVIQPESFAIWGLSGTIVVLVGSLVPAIAYRGKLGEKYSLLNHFVSELGDRNISLLSSIFNSSLILAGILFSMFMIQLARYLGTIGAFIAGAVGVIAAFGCCMVGAFPMDTIKKHDRCAAVFFTGGLSTVFLFGIISLLDKRHGLPMEFVLYAFIVAMFFAVYIMIPRKTTIDIVTYKELDAQRPVVWALPLLEWISMLGIIGWIAAVSLCL